MFSNVPKYFEKADFASTMKIDIVFSMEPLVSMNKVQVAIERLFEP